MSLVGREELLGVVGTECNSVLKGKECRIFFISLFLIFNICSATEELDSVNEILKSIKPDNPIEDLSFLLSTHGYTTDGRGNLTLSDGSIWRIRENGTLIEVN
jgi:hypothetical protein